MSQDLHAALRTSELQLVPNAGHNVMVEYPDLVAGYLAHFVDQIVGAESPISNLHPLVDPEFGE
jgi:hypothetical protein